MSIEEIDDGLNINRKLSIYKHVKKKAANDAQLLMNRIALIQKEEERARKKIEQTKSRANEILSLRQETEQRVQAYANATGEMHQLQQLALAKNREAEEENRKSRASRIAMMQHKRRGDVEEMLMEKKYMTQVMIQEQERSIQEKQRRREAIKRMEEEQKQRRERERQEKERRMREVYEQKLRAEAAEAKRAEKLVRQLEKKERDWIAKLRNAQDIQEHAYEELEEALHKSELPKLNSPARTSPSSQPIKRGKALRKTSAPTSPSSARGSGSGASAGSSGDGGGVASPETEGIAANDASEFELANKSLASLEISHSAGGSRNQAAVAVRSSSGKAKGSAAAKKKVSPRKQSR